MHEDSLREWFLSFRHAVPGIKNRLSALTESVYLPSRLTGPSIISLKVRPPNDHILQDRGKAATYGFRESQLSTWRDP